MNVFCSNEMTLDGFMDRFRLGAWSSERPSHDEKLGIVSPTSHPPGHWVNNWLLMHTWWNYCKNPKGVGFRELPGWWPHLCAGTVAPTNSTGTAAPALRTFPDLTLSISSSGCSSVFFSSPFNNLVNRNVSLSSRSCSGRVVKCEEESFRLVPSWREVVGRLGTCYLKPMSATGAW